MEKIFGASDYLYFYGPGGRPLSIRSVSTSGVTSVVADRIYFGGLLLGSAGAIGTQDVSTLTDRLGTAATGYPYGTNIGNAAGNDQPDFATYTKDATTGFEYADQRYYSAGLGRFLNPDSSGKNLDFFNPESWNGFGYGNNDPANRRDTTGQLVTGSDDGSDDDLFNDGSICDSLQYNPCNLTLGIPSEMWLRPTPDFILAILNSDGVSATAGPQPGEIGVSVAGYEELFQESCGCPTLPTINWGQVWRDVKTGVQMTGISIWYLGTILYGTPARILATTQEVPIQLGKTPDGRCVPIDPDWNVKWRGSDAFHWHYLVWNQNPVTCIAYPKIETGPDPGPGWREVPR